MRSSIGIDPALAVLLEKAPSVELDYGFVMECLSNYSNPRVKIHHLLKIGALRRIKKGIYIFGTHFLRRPYSAEVLANVIYGPSYVSLEWACQYYRLIPEKVSVVTSVTTKRSKQFMTDVGSFTYDHQSVDAFSCGMTLVRFSEVQQALMATKEKALVDLLTIRRGSFASLKHLKITLFDDLRIEEGDLEALDHAHLAEIHRAHPHSASHYLIQLITKK
jgi:hypothetical protein